MGFCETYFLFFFVKSFPALLNISKFPIFLDEVPSEQLNLQNLSEDSTARQTVTEISDIFSHSH